MNHWQRRAIIAKAEADGVEVEPVNYPGWKFRVRRRCQWNADYQAAIVRIAARPEVAEVLERQRLNPDAPMSDADKAIDAAMMREAFAAGCLTDWSGVVDEKDKALSFTLPAAVRVLEAFPDIFAELQRAADDAARFVPKSETAKAKAVAGN